MLTDDPSAGSYYSTSMSSKEGEIIHFGSKLQLSSITGGGVKDWLIELESQMRSTLIILLKVFILLHIDHLSICLSPSDEFIATDAESIEYVYVKSICVSNLHAYPFRTH